MAASIWLLTTLTVGHVVFPGALAECTWKKVKGTSIPGGSDVLAYSLSECQSACLQKDGCQSIDYDTEGICALHTTQDGQQPTPDSSHFDYICEATSTIRPQLCKTKLDLVFVVDGSTSICRMPITTCSNWKFNLQFIHKIIDDQTIGPDDTRVGLVMFSDEAHVEFNLNKYTDKASLLSVIDNLRYPLGQTNTTGALKTLVSTAFTPATGDRPDVPNVSILITDGNPTRDVEGLPAAMKLVNTSGIHLLAVDVSKYVRNISSNPEKVNKTYFIVKDYSSIELVRIELLKQTCSLGAATTTQPRPATTTQPRPATTTQPRPTELPVCKAKLDLVFVVDGSKSICSPYLRSACLNWVLNRQFIHKIVDAQTIGRDHTRVGVVIFSETARVAFNLNKYTDETSLLAAIDSLRVPLGGTNTTGALKTLVSAAFTPAAGDRPDVPNVSILITDGIPTIDVEELPAAIKQVEASGIHMLAVGVTKMVDEATVRNLSSAPHQINVTYFLANDYSSIELVLGQLQKQACIV